MASGTKLVFDFKDSTDKTVQYSYNNADPSTTAQQVITHAESMIANTAVLAKTLISIARIRLVTTTENDYDISASNLTTRKTTEVINGNPEPDETSEKQSVKITKIE